MTAKPVPPQSPTTTSPTRTGEAPNRRRFLGLSAAAGLALAGGLPVSAATASPDTSTDTVAGQAASTAFRTALSVSPFTELVLGGTALTDGARTATTVEGVQRLFMAHGGNELFARVCTRRAANENGAEHGFERGILRARLARKLGLPLNVELGLWAVYGDISHQPGPDFADYPAITLPGPWESLTLDQMTRAMRQYGALAALQILGTGVRVNAWDLGNEVEFGVAGVGVRSFTTANSYWSYTAPDAVDPEIGRMDAYTLMGMPDADRLAWLRSLLGPSTGRLLAAVAAGIRSVDPCARFSTHTSVIAMQFPGLAAAFWQAMADAGFSVQEFGTSYYPTSVTVGDQLALFKSTATELHDAFGKKVFVAEGAYPSGAVPPPLSWNATVPGYPQTPQGQYAFLRDLTAWGANSGAVSGIRPWAPEYCTGAWQTMSLFGPPTSGLAAAAPALNAMADGLGQAGA
ncbi:MAG: twin-arginine translocation signal domain-containing protein [Streptomycetaceae bacterium]|nr:twin-arginine translocation signal domain-containing protein [Streptomycetaceae bacterium]